MNDQFSIVFYKNNGREKGFSVRKPALFAKQGRKRPKTAAAQAQFFKIT